MDILPENWCRYFNEKVDESLWRKPAELTELRRKQHTVFPPEGKIFRAFELLPPEKVRVVLLGQDPYHDDGQAEGLAFSVPDGVSFPPSLRNIFKEYAEDLGRDIPLTGHLGNWAEQGILLLNAIMSVDAHSPGSHVHFGWEKFTDAVISAISTDENKKVFIFWGAFAKKKIPLVDQSRHLVISGVHPSPLSAYRGFFGSKPFSEAAEFLNWSWPGV